MPPTVAAPSPSATDRGVAVPDGQAGAPCLRSTYLSPRRIPRGAALALASGRDGAGLVRCCNLGWCRDTSGDDSLHRPTAKEKETVNKTLGLGTAVIAGVRSPDVVRLFHGH